MSEGSDEDEILFKNQVNRQTIMRPNEDRHRNTLGMQRKVIKIQLEKLNAKEKQSLV